MTAFEVNANMTVRPGQLEGLKLLRDYADDHFMTFYGEQNAQLLDLAKAHLHHRFKWFSFVKGLESPSS